MLYYYPRQPKVQRTFKVRCTHYKLPALSWATQIGTTFPEAWSFREGD